ncbi:MAG: hypothetical protein JW850_03100, partial [Thermoflexales bacterium]|nr:hypothetical protein [Thermoflexales bacterium]
VDARLMGQCASMENAKKVPPTKFGHTQIKRLGVLRAFAVKKFSSMVKSAAHVFYFENSPGRQARRPAPTRAGGWPTWAA